MWKPPFYSVIAFLCFLISTIGCETPTEVDVEGSPLLQIDATFFAGDRLPVMRIRRTFKATGSQRYEVKGDQIWADGAVLRLLRNGKPVSVSEIAPGRFSNLLDSSRIMPGDTFQITVQWQDLKASALAVVPLFDPKQMQVSLSKAHRVADTRLRNAQTGLIDTLATYAATVSIRQAAPPPVMLIQVASASENDLEEHYGNVSGIVPSNKPLVYHSFYRDDPGTGTINLSREVYEYQHLRAPQLQEMTVRAVVVVPEAVYGDYVRTYSDFFTPVTITNVEQGVGLFIGATRDTLSFTIPLSQATMLTK